MYLHFQQYESDGKENASSINVRLGPMHAWEHDMKILLITSLNIKDKGRGCAETWYFSIISNAGQLCRDWEWKFETLHWNMKTWKFQFIWSPSKETKIFKNSAKTFPISCCLCSVVVDLHWYSWDVNEVKFSFTRSLLAASKSNNKKGKEIYKTSKNMKMKRTKINFFSFLHSLNCHVFRFAVLHLCAGGPRMETRRLKTRESRQHDFGHMVLMIMARLRFS